MFDFYKGKRHSMGLMKAYNPSDNTKGREFLNAVLLPRFAKRLKDGYVVLNIGKHREWDYSLIFNNFQLRCDYKTMDNDPVTEPDIIDDITATKQESNSIDAIVYIGMSNIKIDNNLAISSIYKLLKPGGVCLMSLHDKSLFELLDKFKIDEVYYIYGPNNDGWSEFYSDGDVDSYMIICRKPNTK